MAKANRMGNRQKHGVSRKNYFKLRAKTMSQGKKGAGRYFASIERNKKTS